MLVHPLGRAVAAAAIFSLGAAGAHADTLPPIKQDHPRVWVNQKDLDELRKKLPAPPMALPRKGLIRFTLTPQPLPAGVNEVDILGQYSRAGGLFARSGFFIRHVVSASNPAQAGMQALQIGLTTAGRPNPALIAGVHVPLGKATTLTLSYDLTRGAPVATIHLSGMDRPIALSSQDAEARPELANQLFGFLGLPGDQISNVEIRDDGAASKPVWEMATVDMRFANAWWGLQRQTSMQAAVLATCHLPYNRQLDAPECDVAEAGRTVIIDAAKQFALAYKLSGQSVYAEAARAYADRIMLINDQYAAGGYGAGGSWAMASRVGALGLLYDWFHGEWDAAYKQKIAAYILASLTARQTRADQDDLMDSICGRFNAIVSGAGQAPACSTNASLPGLYVQSPNLSAHSGVLMGLFALGDEQWNVHPLLSTIYTHFRDGFLPARDFISADGGHHTAFGYATSAGELGDRLLMWKKALDTGRGEELFRADWLKSTAHPYIYGLRSDNRFPALGDHFDQRVDYPIMGSLLLNAVVAGQDPIAQAFYEEQVDGTRPRTENAVLWDYLLYRNTVAASTEKPRELSRAFPVSGLVLMRSSWDNDAALLTFKSSSFMSESHQHLDQNSYTLYYKAPLLLDTGLYDSYDSVHWNNYYRRTIAHNSIVVFDPEEQFKNGQTLLSNDGGQWFKASMARYPTLAQIQPGGSNALTGLTHFEDGGDYSYAVGNASRAYSERKMDQQDGFVRSIVYLRSASASKTPVFLVFDRVRTEKQLLATSLLHFAQKPTSAATSAVDGNEGGRERLQFDTGQALLTVRNGAGMVMVNALLPEQAQMVLAGGMPAKNRCDQQRNSDKETEVPSDCRFTVRDGKSLRWLNFPYTPGKQDYTGDTGVWRLEISPPQAPADKAPQDFLNVLHAGPNTPGPISNAKAERLSAGAANTEAVLVDGHLSVIFNRGMAPATSYLWTAPAAKTADILATGLAANTRFALTITLGNEGLRYQLSADENGKYLSSPQGVLRIME